MSWKDAKGPWARAQGRRVLGCRLAVIATLVLGVFGSCVGGVPALFVIVLDDSAGKRDALRLATLFLLGTTVVVGLCMIAVRRLYRQQRVQHLIPTHDGLVCPHCMSVLPSDMDRGACPTCGRDYTIRAIRRYWEWYALSPARAMHWMSRRRRWGVTKRWQARVNRWWSPGRRREWLRAMNYMVLLGLVCVGLWNISAPTGTTVGTDWLRLIGFGLVGGGIANALGVAAYGPRIGRGRYCATCGYRQTPRAEPAERCPECGSHWHELGATVTGAPPMRDPMRQRGAVMVAIGVLLVLIGGVPGMRGCAAGAPIVAGGGGTATASVPAASMAPATASAPSEAAAATEGE